MIQPEYSYNVAFPLSLAQAATCLIETLGQQVICYDLNLITFDNVLRELQGDFEEPDVFGFSGTAETSDQIKKLCQQVKEIFPEAVTIIGGSGAKSAYEELLACEVIDLCFLNDLEQWSLVDVVELEPATLIRMPGIAWRDSQTRKVRVNPIGKLIDLENKLFPRRDLDFIHIDRYLSPDCFGRGRVAGLLTVRGCPHACTYCASAHFTDRRVVARSSDQVREELDYLNRLGYNSFVFEDYEFFCNMERARSICADLKSRDSRWVVKTRIEKCSDAAVRMLAESGCQLVYIGVETLTPSALKLAKKASISREMVKKSIITLKRYGLRVCASIQYGLPEDSVAEFITGTVTFLAEVLDPQHDMVQLHFTTLFPGTELYDQYSDYAREVDIHKLHPNVIAHGFEGKVMPWLTEAEILNVYNQSQAILGDLLTEKAIWHS